MKPFRLTTIILLFAILPYLSLSASGISKQAVASDSGASGDETSQTSNMFLPFTPSGVECATRTDSIFGVQMYGNTSRSSRYLSSIVCSGANWIRSDLDWERIERDNTTPENYSWGAADASAAAARDVGVNMLLTLEEAPTWAAASENGPLLDGMNSELAEFMGAVAERYDGDGVDDAPGIVIEHFEIYNEPDAGLLGGGQNRWGNDGDKYAEMLSVIYPAIKAANPNAKVIFGGIAYDWFTDWGLLPNEPASPGPFVRTFLDDALAAGAGDYFDIMGFHQYPDFASIWTTDGGAGLIQKTQAIRDVLARYNLDKPLMITESGTYSGGENRTDDPERQARYVAILLTQAMAAGVDNHIWFSMHDINGYTDFSGLVTGDGDHKQAMQSYQTIVNTLGGSTFVRTLPAADTGSAAIEAHQFTGTDGSTIYSVWTNPITVNTPATLSVPAALATIIDIAGNSTNISDADDGAVDGQVTIVVSYQPTYIKVQ